MSNLRYTPAIDAAGDEVIRCGETIKLAGDDMYGCLLNMCDSGQLTGEGVEQALRASQARWNAACSEFATAEQTFGTRVKDAYSNMIATDMRYASYF
jgi:hypothetical protein